jgi:hypothetical protein
MKARDQNVLEHEIVAGVRSEPQQVAFEHPTFELRDAAFALGHELQARNCNGAGQLPYR